MERHRLSLSGFRVKGAVAFAFGLFFACPRHAPALDSSFAISQYAHTAWTTRSGFLQGAISAIAQTPDGYLWLGTEFGLAHFDGVRPVLLESSAGQRMPGFVRDLLAARDGRLWIGTNQGLASWKDGKLTQYRELSGQAVLSLFEDHEGTIWAGGGAPAGRLCAIGRGNSHCYGEDGAFGGAVLSISEDGIGRLWAGGATGLWRWSPGPPALFPVPGPAPEIYSLTRDGNSTVLIGRRDGLSQISTGGIDPYPVPGAGLRVTPVKLLRDRDGGLWIGTNGNGLFHVHQGKTDQFTRADGLSGNAILSLFEDREGNIWVSTNEGLDRFRDFAVTTISEKQGLSGSNVLSVLADRGGNIWLATADGLNRWSRGEISVYRRPGPARRARFDDDHSEVAREIVDSGLPDNLVESLFEDDGGRIWVGTRRGIAYFENGRFIPVNAALSGQLHAMTGDSGNLWFSDQKLGLVHLFPNRTTEQTPFSNLGHKDWADALIADTTHGGLWLGFFQGGVAHIQEGQPPVSYDFGEAPDSRRVTGFQFDRDGALWTAADGGLTRLKDGRFSTLTRNGLPCDAAKWVIEDLERSLWLGMGCGVVRIPRQDLDAWVAGTEKTIQIRKFDTADGVVSHAATSGYSPRVARSPDGRIWFVPIEGGVSVLDPRHLPANPLPPPVHIEQVIADRKTWPVAPHLGLPPRVRDLEIDYTALSLVVPEKLAFRFRLDNWDRDWRDAGNRRQAFYDSLPPGDYVFRVIASNNNGIWNKAGDAIAFSIAPAYYQTTWFRGYVLLLFLTLCWALYHLRMRQLKREFSLQAEASIDERTRIAQELHDTLLQTLHGLLFKFQAARNLVPRRPDEAIKALDNALNSTESVIAESRDAIQGLRSEPAGEKDLAQFLVAIGQEMAEAQDGKSDSPAFHVTVEGERRALAPALHHEICRIACELLRNAFQHAEAREIEAEIRYDSRMLRLRIRDDGKGIEPAVLERGGREGHWGLPGVRERAARIHMRFDIWSQPGAGTEIELRVPAAIAYETSGDGSRSSLFRLFTRKEKRRDE